MHPKDPVPSDMKANVVYNIPCQVCPKSYIGQTSRTLKTRLGEHKAAVKKAQCETSAVAEHVWKKQHQMDWGNVTVITHESNQQKQCFLESWYIQRNRTMNRECGTLPLVYKCLVE